MRDPLIKKIRKIIGPGKTTYERGSHFMHFHHRQRRRIGREFVKAFADPIIVGVAVEWDVTEVRNTHRGLDLMTSRIKLRQTYIIIFTGRAV